jgi:hypothetical protein
MGATPRPDYYQQISFEETFSRESPNATETVWVPYATRYQFAQSMLGGSWDTGNGVQFFPPSRYYNTDLYCHTVKFTPLGNSQFGEWLDVQAVLSYGLLPVSDPDNPELGEVTMSTSVQARPMPVGQYKWAEGTDNNKPLPDDADRPSLFEAQMEFQIAKNYSPDFDYDWYMEKAGKINDAPVEFLNHTFPSKTLLFLVGDDGHSIGALGPNQHKKTLRFQYRKIGWLKLKNYTDNAYQLVSPAPYESTNLQEVVDRA